MGGCLLYRADGLTHIICKQVEAVHNCIFTARYRQTKGVEIKKHDALLGLRNPRMEDTCQLIGPGLPLRKAESKNRSCHQQGEGRSPRRKAYKVCNL